MTTETMEKRLVYSIDEVSKMLGISRNLAYVLGRQKKLPGVVHLGVKRMVVSAVVIDRLLEGLSES